eukprot:TRINITY_DN8641_c0_g1_i1.p1 TRINITY_DN8641_c0_g1~~TRINITY_DN8641_c0_g1_i1.p1  ORF type:complete len:282 (-),score=62.15 TRINITY_DN8641_c0_g1_i1:108-839(-)
MRRVNDRVVVYFLVIVFSLFVSGSQRVNGHDMPKWPSSYGTKTVATISGTGLANETVLGDVYVDGVNQRSRTDTLSNISNHELLTFNNGTDIISYSILNGGSSCTKTIIPSLRRDNEDEDDPCDKLTYQGTTFIDNQNVQYWSQHCNFGNTWSSSLFYWNGNTPVRTLINNHASNFNMTSQVDYPGFFSGVPDPSYFVIPAICNETAIENNYADDDKSKEVKLLEFVAALFMMKPNDRIQWNF